MKKIGAILVFAALEVGLLYLFTLAKTAGMSAIATTVLFAIAHCLLIGASGLVLAHLLAEGNPELSPLHSFMKRIRVNR